MLITYLTIPSNMLVIDDRYSENGEIYLKNMILRYS